MYCLLPTANCGLWTAHCELPTAHCELWTVDCGLWIVDCPLRTAHHKKSLRVNSENTFGYQATAGNPASLAAGWQGFVDLNSILRYYGAECLSIKHSAVLNIHDIITLEWVAPAARVHRPG
jgi:hypothetical protein